MTAYVEDGSEAAPTSGLVEDYVVPAVEHGVRARIAPNPALDAQLATVLGEVHHGPFRGPSKPEQRMIPSVERKGGHTDVVR
jgi:hypothetical protein